MKILFLTSGSVRSSLTYRAFSLARELKELGHDTALVCPSADKYNGFKAEKIKELDGVRIFQPRQFNTKRVEINLFPYIFGALYRTLREKPDMIYIYKPTPISIIGLAVKFFSKPVVILDMDDLGSEVMKIEGHPKHQRLLVKWCEDIAANYSDMIVAASNFLFEKYRAEFPLKPIHLMPNGIDKSWFAPLAATTKANRIVYMGSLNRKNIVEPLFDVFPSVLEKHPDAELLIIGDGKYFGYFKDKCEALGIGEHTTFTGWLPVEKARENLMAGDIGYVFMPDDITTRAASNMKTPQYMIRGVVPFVSRTGDLPEMVDEGQAGYIVENETAEDIRDSLLFALQDKQRKQRKAQAARDFAAQNFAWSKLAKDFVGWLEKYGAIPGKEPEKDGIFFVCANVPGNVGGAEIRNLYLLKSIRASVDKTRLYCVRENSDLSAVKAIENTLDVPVFSAEMAPDSSKLNASALLISRVQPFMERSRRSELGKMIRAAAQVQPPIAIHLEQLESYYLLRPHIGYLKKKGIKIILDCHNVETNAFRGAIEAFPWWKRIVGIYLFGRLKSLEIEAVENADAVFACSANDAGYFQKYNPNIYVIPNGVDCDIFRPEKKSDNKTIIFIGGTGYPPNAEALRFFLKDIYPRIQQEIPDVQMTVIGATEKFLRKNKIYNPSVTALGFVTDVNPYLLSASVGICPIRHGSGTRLKILTFMASGLPVISTRKGAEGINYLNGENIVIADTDEDFARETVTLLKYPKKRERIGANARELVSKAYDWKIISEDIRSAYKEILFPDIGSETLAESMEISHKIA
jgi:glycosyltransferase involved in cell wall biosynthesis